MSSSLDEAFYFYRNSIYNENTINLLKIHKLKIAGHIHSVMWELFGSILTGRHGNGTTGADLQGWEVKSSIQGSSYEYQYHLNTGENKLIEDGYVNHLFCSYSNDYQDVIVKAIPGYELKDEFFDVWLPEYRLNYDRSVVSSVRRQRFRKSISYGFVQRHGRTLLEIKTGDLYSKDDILLKELNLLVG